MASGKIRHVRHYIWNVSNESRCIMQVSVKGKWRRCRRGRMMGAYCNQHYAIKNRALPLGVPDRKEKQ